MSARPQNRARLWCRGWFFWFRAVYKVRAKKHGARAEPWPIAFGMAKHARYIVYGQHFRRAP